eukprot:gene5831-1038_t
MLEGAKAEILRIRSMQFAGSPLSWMAYCLGGMTFTEAVGAALWTRSKVPLLGALAAAPMLYFATWIDDGWNVKGSKYFYYSTMMACVAMCARLPGYEYPSPPPCDMFAAAAFRIQVVPHTTHDDLVERKTLILISVVSDFSC